MPIKNIGRRSRLLELARTEIERLNEGDCADRPGIFYLLHRPRKWNRQQGAWMEKNENGASWRPSTGCYEPARPMPLAPRSATCRSSVRFAT